MARKRNPIEKTARQFQPSEAPEIYVFRGESVVLDKDVALLFGVETKRLNEQVARNPEKFGDDFAFRLSSEEFAELRSRNATSNEEWGGTRYPPRVFTEHGVVMAATILKSSQAIHATRFVVRTFVEARLKAIGKKQSKVSGQPALPLEVRTTLMSKVNDALGHVLDAMIDQDRGRAVRDEARTIAAEGIEGLKEHLKRPGIQNEKTLAEVRKIMAEAEGIEVETDGKRTANKHLQLALLAKKLRLILEAQHYAETGKSEGLIQILAALEKPD